MKVDADGFISRFPYVKSKQSTGLLTGLRLSVKDLFDIKGLATGAGNPDWLATHDIPDANAEIINDLLAAGAGFVGKTLTDELAYSLNGSNVHYGTLPNPGAPLRITGGSSSGAAVSVCRQAADIGLGTDTGGSIRVPASYCGLYGFRPTHGVLSLTGCVPLAPRFDTVGWMCRDLETSVKVGQVLLQQAIRPFKKLLIIKPVIAGVSLWSDACADWVLRHVTGLPIDYIELDDVFLQRASEIFRVLQGREIWRMHGEWISACSPVFADDIQQRIDWCSQLTEQDEAGAESLLNETMREFKSQFCLDTLAVLPTTPGAAPRLDATAGFFNHYRSQLMGLTALAGLSGFPQLTMPVLSDNDAPWGLSLMAQAGSDLSVLAAASGFTGRLQ